MNLHRCSLIRCNTSCTPVTQGVIDFSTETEAPDQTVQMLGPCIVCRIYIHIMSSDLCEQNSSSLKYLYIKQESLDIVWVYANSVALNGVASLHSMMIRSYTVC